MKVRIGFVSNSSSSSFVLLGSEPTEMLDKYFTKIDNPKYLERIKDELAKDNVEYKEPVYLSSYIYDCEESVRNELNNNPDIYCFEEVSNSNYLPESDYNIVDKEKNIALRKTDEEKIDYFTKTLATIDDIKEWTNLINTQRMSKTNKELNTKIRALKPKIEDMYMDFLGSQTTQYFNTYDIDMSKELKHLYNPFFLNVILPQLYDAIQQRYNDRIQEFIDEELW